MFLCKLFKIFRSKAVIGVVLAAALINPQFGLATDAKKPSDTQPPTAPKSLVATSVSKASVSLKWKASVDNKGVFSYLIYKNSTYVASTKGTSYTVPRLKAATAYSFYVKAKDRSGNISKSSNVRKVTTKTAAAAKPAAKKIVNPIITSPPVTATAKILTGYYASWSAYSGYTPLNIPASKLTTINYAFANIGSDLKIALGDSYIDPTNFTKLNALKKTYPAVKTIISVGGWDWSGRFSDAALTDSSRTVFADSVVAFIKKYGFNGVDIDWEYPVGGGLSTNVNRPSDKQNFTLLLQKLRQKLDAQGAIDGQKYLLTIAGAAGSFYTANTELNLIGNYINYANVMTYDIHGPWDSYTDFNAPLYNPTEASPQYKCSIDSTVKSWIFKGFPPSKIVVGMPFYGYAYSGITNSSNGLYKPFTSAKAVSYDKIVSNYLNASGFNKYTHPDAKVPWLFNGSVFISYDDGQSLTEKAKYVMQNNLAGASIWELSQNKNGVLLDAIYSNLK